MSYLVPDPATDPAKIAEKLLDLEELRHLKDFDAKVAWLIRCEPKVKAQRRVLGTAYMPSVQGELSDCFEWLLDRLFGFYPDFLIVLDQFYWEDATPELREILVYHELLHCVQAENQYGAPRFHKDGTPIWAIRGHDVEEFTSVVRRYGPWHESLRQFIEVANSHPR